MTAINTIRFNDRAIIMTDGAGYDVQGIIRAMYQKVVAIPHLRAAVAVRGSANAVGILAAALGSRFSNFDDLVANGGAVAERIYDENFAGLTAHGDTEMQVFLAGWSEARGSAETYVLLTESNPESVNWETPVWQFVEADDFTAAPLPSDQQLRRHGFRASSVEEIDPVSDGLKVMEAQRHMKLPTRWLQGVESAYLVGGFVTMTEVSEAGVSQRIVRRWNDRIGERINPHEKVAGHDRQAPTRAGWR